MTVDANVIQAIASGNQTSIQHVGDAIFASAYLGVISGAVPLFIILLLYRRQIINGITIKFKIAKLMKKLSFKTGMPVVLVSDNIDFKISDEFESIINDLADKGYKEIILIINTLGGNVFSMHRMSNAILKFKGKVHCYIPKYSMSAGTAIALSCDSVHMGETSSLGATDPQIGILFWVHSSKAWKTILKKKGAKAKDESIAMSLYADQYTKMIRNQLDHFPLLDGNSKLKNMLSSGDLPHAMQLDKTFLSAHGLKVKDIDYKEIFQMFKKEPRGIALVIHKSIRRK